MFKRESVAEKEVTANKHFPSSERFFGGEILVKNFHLFIHFEF